MFNAIWSILENVKNSNTTKIWRLIVTGALFVLFISGISYVSWSYSNITNMQAGGTQRDRNITDIKISVNEIQGSVEELKLLLLEKFIPAFDKYNGEKHSEELRTE